jgi:NAD(P)-dependent dehydrogenase (short-subunit alcohol dehydrogenase family)
LPTTGPYGSSKLATVGVAEALHKELSEADGSPLRRISVVALCPAIVRTEILTSSATHFADERSGDPTALSRLEAVLDKGMLPTVAVREVFRHAAAGKFYCIVDNDVDRDGMTLGVDNGISERYAISS